MTIIHNSINFLTGAIASVLILTDSQAIAQTTTETDRNFIWIPVSGTESYSELGNPHSPLEPWYLNTDLIIRRGDLVTFETVSPNADYVQFLGNCQSWQLTPRAIGEFIGGNNIRYSPAEVNWQTATDGRSVLLSVACDTD